MKSRHSESVGEVLAESRRVDGQDWAWWSEKTLKLIDLIVVM